LHEYDENFYRFLASFAVRSAEQIVPLLSPVLPINSVVDFGCGQGAWLNIWRKAGARVMGVDGPVSLSRSIRLGSAARHSRRLLYIGRVPIADQDISFTQVSLTSSSPASVIILATVSCGQ
jgi:hypothetical protein